MKAHLNLRRVYISGPDCSGKTTLSKEISRITGIPVTHFSFEPDAEKRKKIEEEYEKIADNAEDVILDRAWNGPYVYHGILGDQPYSLAKIIDLNRRFVASGGTLIHMGANPVIIMKRLEERGDEFIKPEMSGDICYKYLLLRKQLNAEGIPFFYLDSSHLERMDTSVLKKQS